ncbi:MAG: hypothetical protein ABI690_17300 [Chloroflexota bacterium]
MSKYMEERGSWITGTHGMRNGLLDLFTDADLRFNPGGQNMTLGALCKEMGEIEYDYLQSLKTLKTDFSYRNTEDGLDTKVAKLKAWYESLDAEMEKVLNTFSDEDFTKSIERASGYSMPMSLQLEVYLQALLIFLGKLTIFMRAMNKTLPPGIQEYIG